MSEEPVSVTTDGLHAASEQAMKIGGGRPLTSLFYDPG
jgi:hypothetical protein